jgi:hypothetical protein
MFVLANKRPLPRCLYHDRYIGFHPCGCTCMKRSGPHRTPTCTCSAAQPYPSIFHTGKETFERQRLQAPSDPRLSVVFSARPSAPCGLRGVSAFSAFVWGGGGCGNHLEKKRGVGPEGPAPTSSGLSTSSTSCGGGGRFGFVVAPLAEYDR